MFLILRRTHQYVLSVHDGSRPQSCVNVTQQQAPGHVKVMGAWVCQ